MMESMVPVVWLAVFVVCFVLVVILLVEALGRLLDYLAERGWLR